MTPPDKVKYVSFGGAQVPANLKRQVINQNGKQIYCVWTDNNGGKVTYPEQRNYNNGETVYVQYSYGADMGEKYNYIAKGVFDYRFDELTKHGTKKILSDNTVEYRLKDDGANWHMTTTDGKANSISFDDTSILGSFRKDHRDTTPRIETNTVRGIVFDTQRTSLSNMRGATVTGSNQEDNIILEHSENCYVDVANANNNMFVSDNVRDVNGKNNRIKLGNNDTLEKVQHDYETNTENTDTYKH